MPIFEFTCPACGTTFELLVRADTPIQCPQCGEKRVEKKWSVFASFSSSQEAPSCRASCPGGFERGACGSGRCGLR